ncbi:MAG: hypothetical protein OZ921_08310 [Sorangiineae bacterium]|nr:hypothetical protein [Polyangiaceae bacterium]MEB2322502.1 hypothetical protein [Sorangiineae bacterium]
MGRRFAVTLLAAALLGGCSVPIATNLDEADSNRVMAALEERGVAAQKEADPASEGKWRVTVARDDASAAVSVLTDENLPPPATPGVLEALGQGSIVPSRTAEHAKLVTGKAGELERSLGTLDGVLSVRVHLAVPLEDTFGDGAKPTPPTASVLIRHRGATPPIAASEVARLVAGAVAGLEPERVSVVLTAVAPVARPRGHELARIGPVTITRSSMTPLRVIVGAAALLNVVLLGALLLLWSRFRRARLQLEELQAASAPQDPR